MATVDSKGNVTAVAKGTAIITVKASSGVKDRFALTVKAAPVEEDTSSDDIIEDTGDNGDNSGSDSKHLLHLPIKQSPLSLNTAP